MSSAIPPGVNFGVIGLGQCGGNLTEEFYLRGYSGIALNTSYTDLRAGMLPALKRFHIGSQGRDGAGQDMNLGSRYLRANSKRILETVERELEEVEMFLLVSGLGGGTGGNIGGLAEIVAELDKPICALTALPMNGEGTIKKINAVRGLETLISSPVSSVMLIDNQQILASEEEIPLTNFFRRVNGVVVSLFDLINRVTRHPSMVPVRNFDSEDLRKFFLTRGILLMSEIVLKDDDWNSEEAPLLRLKKAWNQGGLFGAGYDYSTAAMTAVVLLASKSRLQNASLSKYEGFFKGIKEIVSSGGLYSGIFQTSEDETPRLLSLAAGLPLPDRISELLEHAKTEGKMLTLKFSETESELDVRGLRELNLLAQIRHAPQPVSHTNDSVSPPPPNSINADLNEKETADNAPEPED